jgi:hypothetical protein
MTRHIKTATPRSRKNSSTTSAGANPNKSSVCDSMNEHRFPSIHNESGEHNGKTTFVEMMSRRLLDSFSSIVVVVKQKSSIMVAPSISPSQMHQHQPRPDGGQHTTSSISKDSRSSSSTKENQPRRSSLTSFQNHMKGLFQKSSSGSFRDIVIQPKMLQR